MARHEQQAHPHARRRHALARRHVLAVSGACGLALSGLTVAVTPADAHRSGPPPIVPVSHPARPKVLVTGLNNPRELQWDQSGKRLIIAEAGKGGSVCGGSNPEGLQCAGLTGSVSVLNEPWEVRHATRPRRVVTGLFSSAGPDGSFAVGSDGADATDVPGEYIVQETYVAPSERPAGVTIPGADQLGYLLVSEGHQTTGDGRQTFPYANIAGAEISKNPGGGQIDSDPYAVVFVDPTPHGPVGADGYALIADAASNTVWKLTPDLSKRNNNAPPPYTISVFASFPDRPANNPNAVEFVPTALALDGHGGVYVAGLGSEATGQAQVVRYNLRTRHETGRWTGFTAVTGIAATRNGFIVSQLFGNTSPGPNGPMGVMGNVVKVTRHSRRSIDVPFPAGLVVDKHENVYVSAFSVFDNDGPDPASIPPGAGVTPKDLVGQVWRIRF